MVMSIATWSFGNEEHDPVLTLLEKDLLVVPAGVEIDELAARYSLGVHPLEEFPLPLGGGQIDTPVYWLTASAETDVEYVMRNAVAHGLARFAAPIYIPEGGSLNEAVAPLRFDLIIDSSAAGDDLAQRLSNELELTEDTQFGELVPPFRRWYQTPEVFAAKTPNEPAVDGWWLYCAARHIAGDHVRIQPNWYRLLPLEGPPLGDPWNLAAINVPAKLTFPNGEASTLAVIDTCFDLAHPELQHRVVDAKHHGAFVLPYAGSAGLTADLTADERTSAPDPALIGRGVGHGTAVAGVIAQVLDAVERASGRNDLVSLLPIRADMSSQAEIAKALGWAIASPTETRVINMSFSAKKTGTKGPIAAQIIRAEPTIVMCAAAGTLAKGPYLDAEHTKFPASMKEVMAVAAAYSPTQRYNANAGEKWYSPRTAQISVIAPGYRLPVADIGGPGGYNVGEPAEAVTGAPDRRRIDWIYALYTGDEVGPRDGMSFFAFSGTSGATPHVSCLAALVFRKQPLLSSAEVRTRIEKSCSKNFTPTSEMPTYDFQGHPNGHWSQAVGYGMVNFEATLA